MIDKNGIKVSADTEKYVMALLEKAEEAYLMSLEIINKPTIKYRTEGFCFFICNAWELLLKAFIIRRENDIDAIYFKGSSTQTLGLQECIDKIFTSTTDYTKMNLHVIREIRNKSTHNILPDYDFKFAPTFQRCISNFNTFFSNHFSEYKLNRQITAFVALSNLPDEMNSALALNAKSLLHLKMLEDKINGGDNSDLITQTITLMSTNKASEADVKFALDNNASDKVSFISVLKDINKSHPYTTMQAVTKINETLNLSLGAGHGFTKTTFTNICKDKKVSDNQQYFYHVDYYNQPVKKYSEKLIEYIVHLYSQCSEEERAHYRKRGH